eukprot:5362930-Prymnesium_polylepis.1
MAMRSARKAAARPPSRVNGMETAHLHLQAVHRSPDSAHPGSSTRCVQMSRRCRAGGRRRGGEHRAVHRRRPPRRLSGAARPHG